MMTDMPCGEPQSQSRWGRLRSRLFHVFFLLRRPMTLGVRAIVHDAESGEVFLIRHTYVPGWHLPGGGVETGETAEEALVHELREEGNIELSAPPELRAVYHNRNASRRDHVVLYMVTGFRQSEPHVPDREIAETGFFHLDALPSGTTPATRRRLAEIFGREAVSPYW